MLSSTPASKPAPGDLALMSPNLIWGLLQAGAEYGLPTDGWIAGLNLDRAQLNDPDLRVTAQQTVSVIERAQKMLPPTAALDLGERQNVGNFALLGLAMTTAATLGDAISLGMRYTPVVGGLMRFAESTCNQPHAFALRAEMTVDAPAIHRFVCEEFISSCLALAHGLVGPALRPRWLEFSYPAPDYVDRYEAVFGCPLHFDQPQDRMVIDASWLEAPLPTHNPIAARHVLGLLHAQMPTQARGEVTAATERLLRTRLAQDPRLGDIATQLHMSERTLRRQLTAEGSSFRDILGSLRIDRAYALLRDRSLSIYQVGAAIGYRDPREFRRAFRRLTGTTPRAARERLLEGDAAHTANGKGGVKPTA